MKLRQFGMKAVYGRSRLPRGFLETLEKGQPARKSLIRMGEITGGILMGALLVACIAYKALFSAGKRGLPDGLAA